MRMNCPPQNITNRVAQEPPGMSLEEALLACMPADDAPAAVAALRHQANAGPDDDTSQANTSDYCSSEKQFEEEDVVVVPHPSLVRDSTPLGTAVLACMPGAFQVPGPSNPTTTTTTGDDYVDPLQVMVEEGQEEELRSVSETTTVDIEYADQQQTAQTSNIVSAYRVTEQETIVGTPLKDNRVRILSCGFLVTAAVALIVGLSVGLTVETVEEPPSEPVDRLVSSINVTADEEGSFIKANRYTRTEDGKETVFTTGSAVWSYCEVLPCNEGGCEITGFGKVYKPGCCRGDDCDQRKKCGRACPQKTNICHPAYVGCKDASCFECERGPDGEDLYAYRSASFNVNCLRTGVATGFNDKDDNVMHIYKWAIVCGFNIRGGNERENYAPGEYICMAVRSGDGITKTTSQPFPCQLIQLVTCGCAPGDVYTLGLPPPDKPCKTKEDCPYLCGDAGEEEAKTLCEAFPGIEWWEGDALLGQTVFFEPEELLFGNVTIQIDIYGE